MPLDLSGYAGLLFWYAGDGRGGQVQVDLFDNRNPSATGISTAPAINSQTPMRVSVPGQAGTVSDGKVSATTTSDREAGLDRRAGAPIPRHVAGGLVRD